MRQAQRDEDALLDAYAFGVFTTVTEDNPLDLNTATIEELQSIKGIGDVLAERIVKKQPYKRIEDLLKVDGIGPSMLEKMKPLVFIPASE